MVIDPFETAIAAILKAEGGYSQNPDDPGGATNYGISQRSYPDVDIVGLTEVGAKAIYRRDWWDKYGYGQLPNPIGMLLFSLAVNMGPATAHGLLARALSDLRQPVQGDGTFGPVTIKSANDYRYPDVVVGLLRGGAIERYRRLGKPMFLAGWVRRAMA